MTTFIWKKIFCATIAFLFINQMSGTYLYAQVTLVDQNPATTPNTTATTTPDTNASAPAASPSTQSSPSGQQTLQADSPLSPATPEDNTAVTSEPSAAPNAAVQQATPANVTTFPGRPVVTTFANQANITIDQTSSSEFRMNYDITANGSFGGAIINFGASPAGAQNLSSVSQYQFQMATSTPCAAGTPCLKVEFVDSNNQLASTTVDGLSANPTTVTITQAELQQSNPLVDFTSIKQINFVVDQNLATNHTGFYDIQAGGLAFTPTVTAQTGTATPTQFPDTPAITTFSNQSTVTVDQTSNTQFRTNYDLSTPGSFGGSIINYAEATGGSADLSGVTNFVFNLATNNNCSGSKCIKIEFVDTQNRLAVVNVNGLTSNFQQVSIAKSLLSEANSDVDFTHLRQINFVLEEANTNPKIGFLDVQTGGTGGTTPTPNPNPNPEPTPNPNPNPNPEPTPNPGPTPNPNPEPAPNPEPTPNPGNAVFTGITEGQTVSGVVKVQPDLAQTPDIRKVFYYLNGTKAGRSYDAPFAWGGENGVDTSKLPDGEYTLSALYTTPQGGDQIFTVRFNIKNGNTVSAEAQSQAGREGIFTGLTANQTVSGQVTIQPDLQAEPNIHKVFYYIDGNRVDKVYAAPFAVTVDTSILSNGPHTLSILYGTTDADFLSPGDFLLEIPFTVSGGTETPNENETSATAPASPVVVQNETAVNSETAGTQQTTPTAQTTTAASANVNVTPVEQSTPAPATNTQTNSTTTGNTAPSTAAPATNAQPTNTGGAGTTNSSNTASTTDTTANGTGATPGTGTPSPAGTTPV